ncbi:hypothetical protein AURANDRAFT_68050 [Aureococcus anophagefferens]|uniref:F5/8 type C domain-containing protein n=1 Tax=Aureococcus anophagefferens TaxID=44056 RepID=F0YNB8_AURAN|nr:hypothetical protein AURANDRAFT_68050 [Aureococcus anophagefferens]EGB03393.1 hypothetical protein AURANDRAFT_68050 [Aureococcus anophagefferens]|eukprot:XP_009041923.1 hypothetical protein AURANDRAFT_68050 [Aureococcus anophagefferens]
MRVLALALGALRLAAGAFGGLADGRRDPVRAAADTGDEGTTTSDALDDSTLVAHYGFNDQDAADDHDDVNDYDGTIGGATFANGRDGSVALTFDGTDDYVSMPSSLTMTLIGSAARTVCLWAKIADFDGGTLFSYDSNLDGMRFGFSTGTAAGEFALLGYGDAYDFDVTVSGTDDGEWHHYCNTYDMVDWRLYVDGALVKTQTVVLNTGSANAFQVGRRSEDGSYKHFFSGTMDELSIWSSALSLSNVKELYSGYEEAESEEGNSDPDPTPRPTPTPVAQPDPTPRPTLSPIPRPSPRPTFPDPTPTPTLRPTPQPTPRPSPRPTYSPAPTPCTDGLRSEEDLTCLGTSSVYDATSECAETLDGIVASNEGWWSSAYSTTDQWVAYDLGATYELTGVCLLWGKFSTTYYAATNVRVDYATSEVTAPANDQSWTEGSSYKNFDGEADELDDGCFDLDPHVTARSLRLFFAQGVEQAYVSVGEFGVMASKCDVSYTPAPTGVPTSVPTSVPSTAPSPVPTLPPSTAAPTTSRPTGVPTSRPSPVPSSTPAPSAAPSAAPTAAPTALPTGIPSPRPTPAPSPNPTPEPSTAPTPAPTPEPSVSPTTASPSSLPTAPPSPTPSTAAPTTPNPTPYPSTAPTRDTVFFSVALDAETSAYATADESCDAYVSAGVDAIDGAILQNYIEEAAADHGEASSPVKDVTVSCAAGDAASSGSVANVFTIELECFASAVFSHGADVGSVHDAAATLGAYVASKVDDGSFAADRAALAAGSRRRLDESAAAIYVDAQTVSGSDTTVSGTLGPTGTPSIFPTPSPSTPAPSAVPTVTPCAELRDEGLVLDAPSILVANFSTTGDALTCAFDADTDLGGYDVSELFACASILDFDGADDAECYWVDARTLSAGVADAAIVPGDAVAVLDVVLRACDGFRCDCDTATTSSTTAASPVPPLVPVALLEGPTTASVCEGLRVGSAPSTGGGGRDLSYAWTATPTWASSSDATAAATLSAYAAAAGATLAIPVSDLADLATAGVDAVSFELTVTNFLGGVSDSSTPFVVDVRDDNPPSLQIAGGAVQAALAPAALSVKADAVASGCDGRSLKDRSVTLSYNLSKVADDGSLEATGFVSTSKDARYFKLAANALDSATSYELAVTAVDASSGASVTSAITIEVGRSNLVGAVDGGDRVVPLAGVLELDASTSYDPDDADAELAYSWTCDGDCDATLGLGRALETLEVDGDDLGVGSFAFTVVVSTADGREAAATVTHTIVDDDPPAVAIDGASLGSGRVAAAARVVLYGAASPSSLGDDDALANETGFNSTWVLDSGALIGGYGLETWARTAVTKSTTLTTRGHDLVLAAGALVPGATYTLRLEASTGGAVGAAAVTFVAATPPKSGKITASPGRGRALETAFSLTTSSWTSDDPPLAYAFKAFVGDSANASVSTLRAATRDASLAGVILPRGDPNVTIVAIATDVLGGRGEALASVEVGAVALSSDALANLTNDLLDAALANGDSEAVCQTVVAAAGAASGDPGVAATLVDSLADVVGALDADAAAVEQVASALAAASGNGSALASSAASSALESAAALAPLNDGAEAMTSVAAAGLADALSGLLDSELFQPYDNSTEANATDAAGLLGASVDGMGSSLLVGAVAGEAATEVTSGGLRLAAKRLEAGDGDNIIAPPGSDTAVALGGDVDGDVTITEFDANQHAGAEGGDEDVDSKVVRFGVSGSSSSNNRATLSFTRQSAAASRRRLSTSANATAYVQCPPGGGGNVSYVCGDGRELTVACPPTGLREAKVVAFDCAAVDRVDPGCASWRNGTWDHGGCTVEDLGNGTTLCDCDVSDEPLDYSATSNSVFGTYASAFAGLNGRDLLASPLLYWTMATLAGICGCVALVGYFLDKRDAARAAKRVAAAAAAPAPTLDDLIARSLPKLVTNLARPLRHTARVFVKHHSWLKVIGVYDANASRPRRSVTILFQLLTLMLGQAVAFWYAFPVGFCDDVMNPDGSLAGGERAMRNCLAKKTGFADMVAFLLDAEPVRDACTWYGSPLNSVLPEGTTRQCQLQPPEPQDVGFKRLLLIFLGVLISVPFSELFDATFVTYVCAPLKKERGFLKARDSLRLARGPPAGGAPPAPDGGAPPAPDGAAAPSPVRLGLDGRPLAPRRGAPAAVCPLMDAPDAEAAAHAVGRALWRNVGVDGPALAWDELPTAKYYALRALGAVMRGVLKQHGELEDAIDAAEPGSAQFRDLMRLKATLESTWRVQALDLPRKTRPRNFRRTFARHAYEKLVDALEVATAYSERMRHRGDSAEARALIVLALMRRRWFKGTELKIYESQLQADGFFTPPAKRKVVKPVSKRAKAIASVLCLVAFAGPLLFLAVFASSVGHKMTRGWYFSTLFTIFMALFVVEPITHFVIRVAVPAAIYDRLRWMDDPTRADAMPLRQQLFVKPSELLAAPAIAAFDACGARPPRSLDAVAAHVDLASEELPAPPGRPRSLAKLLELRGGGALKTPADVEKALILEAARAFAADEARHDDERDEDEEHNRAHAEKGGDEWSESALADLKKRTHFEPPVYHAQAIAVAGTILFMHPAVRSTVIKQSSTIASLFIIGVKLPPSIEALFTAANEYVPGCKVVIIAWLVAVSLVVAAVAAFKVRNVVYGVKRAKDAAARTAGRAYRSASMRFLDVETAPSPKTVFVEPAPGDRGAAYLAEPEPEAKSVTFEDPAPAPVVAVAAAAFAPPANPRSSQIQKAVRHAAVVAALAPRDPKGYFDLAEQQVVLEARSRPSTPLPSHIKRAAKAATAVTAFGEAGARASARAVVARAAAAEETKAAPADDGAARDETPRAISQALVYAVPEDYVADDAPEAVEAGGGGKVRKKMLGKLKKSAEGHSKKFVGEMRKMFFPT